MSKHDTVLTLHCESPHMLTPVLYINR